MERVHSEFYGSEAEANKAAAHLKRQGYSTKVSYSARADGTHDWLLVVYA